MQQYIAILGFGYQPPKAKLILAQQAVTLFHTIGWGVAVGNLTGTFAVALETAEQLGVHSLAIIDESMSELDRPDTTKIIKVAADKKHPMIAEQAAGALVIGGAKGTLKLVDHFMDRKKPVAAIIGAGGVVDEGALPAEVKLLETLAESITYLSDRTLDSSLRKKTSSVRTLEV